MVSWSIPILWRSPLLPPRPLSQRCDQPLECASGKAMPFMYSWSCKRSYKNGFVWQDLSEDDLILPAHGHDYVLKGSELLDNARRCNRSCTSIDFDHKSAAADVSTQTDHNRRIEIEMEISPSPSDSSPETLATLMKADGQVRLRPQMPAAAAATNHHVQRYRSSLLLMQLISCGSVPFKGCGAGAGAVQHKMRAPRGHGTAETGGSKLEEKEYFSGSLVETKKREFPALKRSNSYNADRSLNLELAEKEIEKLKAKCIPTKTKAHSSTRKEGSIST